MAVPPTQHQATHDQAIRDRIDDEAASWFLLLSDQPGDPELRSRIEAWCSQSDLHRLVWERTRRTYDLVGQTPPAHADHWRPFAESSERARPQTRKTAAANTPHPRATPRRRLMAGGALLALAASAALVAAPGLLLRLNADHITSTAEVRTIVLEDGSRVHLSPESAVGIAYSEGHRNVRLLAGQAFFEVTPQASRPFRVTSGEFVTTVLGTSFDVRLEEDGVSVAVQQGHVRVDDARRSPPASQDLIAGEALRVGPSGTHRGNVPPSEVADWATGQFVARNRPIAEIIDRLRPYYRGAIVVNDNAFANLEVSGVYDLRDPVSTLRNLARLHGATMRQVSPWLVVVTPL